MELLLGGDVAARATARHSSPRVESDVLVVLGRNATTCSETSLYARDREHRIILCYMRVLHTLDSVGQNGPQPLRHNPQQQQSAPPPLRSSATLTQRNINSK